jgi:molybdopterin-biosynthesis enzyme MoeA-like protein
MFSFGGIGSTPDDFTREVASLAFTGTNPVRHEAAKEIIINRLGDRAYPHPIKMADIPINSNLIQNPINKMPGFQLEDRFFFVPGFPQMAHPMIIDILDTFYPKNREKFSSNFVAYTSEAKIIDIMNDISSKIELSCLPAFSDEKRSAEIYLSSFDKEILENESFIFKQKLKKLNIEFKEL